MKKKKLTHQEKVEINTEVKEFVTYFCNLLETAKMEEETRHSSTLSRISDEISSEEQFSPVEDKYKIECIVRDSLNMRSSVLSRKYEIICSLLPSRLSSQDFMLMKSNLTEEGEAILELYKRLKEGGMECIEKEIEASAKKRRAELSKEIHKTPSDLKSLKQKRLQYEMSAFNEKLLAEQRKLHIASTLTEKDLLQHTKESLEEPTEKHPKPRLSERTPLYEVCKKRLRKTGLPTTEQLCRLSAKSDVDEDSEIDDDVYRFIQDEEKVLHAYNIWMKSYFGYHRKSVRNRFKERVIKTIKTINLDSDDDENYFTTESSEGSAIADSSCDSLDDEEEHKIKETFLKEDINNMMLTLENKIRKERTPLAGMELKNHELKMMLEDSTIETSSDDSEEKYDDSADPTVVDLQEVLEKERTIIPNLELTINHLLDEKINHSKSLYELFYNMVNLSVKKEQIRQKLLNESDWQLEKGAFLSGVEYLKENSSVDGDKAAERAIVNSQYDLIKNMSDQDNSLVMHLMEADHKIRQAAEERLENEEEFRRRKELMHEFEEKIRVKVAKLRDLIRKKIHRRLNKLLGKRQKFKQYKDSDTVCSFNSESIDTTLTDVTREIAFLQSFNDELEKEDTRTSDKLYKALTRKCEKFKEKFEKKAAQVEIVYSSHSEDDEFYKDDKYRDQIRLPEEYEKRLHNVKHNISVRYDDSTIRARIKRYKELLHLRKRYLDIPCIKKYLCSSFIPEHLKTMLKQLKKRNLFSMNLEHTAYAMTISLKRIFQQKEETRKRKRESSHDMAESLLEPEKEVNIYAVTTSDTTTSGMDEYKDETQSFLEDIHYNWDRFQMKYFRDKKLQLIKQLTHSTEDIAKPIENFDFIKELKTKRGKLKSYEIVNALELKDEWERRNKKILKEKRLQIKKQMREAHKETDKESRDLKSLGYEEKLLLPIPGTEKELATTQALDPDLILISEFDACVKRKDFQKEYMKFIQEKSKTCYGTDVNEGDEELMLVGKESEMMIVSDQEGVRRFSERLFDEKMLLLLTKGKYTLHQIKLKPYLKYYIKLWKLHRKLYSDAVKYDDAMVNGKFIGILNPDKFERFKRLQTLFMEPRETFWMSDEQREYEKFECELSPTSPVDLDSSKQDETMLISDETPQSLKEEEEEEEEEEDSGELEQELADQLKLEALPCLKDKPQKERLTFEKSKKPKSIKTSELRCQQARSVGPLITLIKKSHNLRSKHWTYPERKFLKSFLCKRDHFSSVKLEKPCYGLLKNDKEFHTADVILYKMLKLMKDPLKNFINNEATEKDQKNSEESTDTDEEVLQFLGKTSFNEVTWEDIEKNFLRKFIVSRGFLLGKQEMFTTEEGCKDKQMYDVRRFLYQDLLYRVPRKRQQICPVEVKRAISETMPQVVDEVDWEKYKVSTPPKVTLLSDEEIMFEQDAIEMDRQAKNVPSAFYKHLFCYRAPVSEDPIKLARKESVLIPKEELGLPRFNFSIPFKIKSSPEMLLPRTSRVHH